MLISELSAYAVSGTEQAHAAPLSAYAVATRCPVLTWRMLLPKLSAYALATRCPASAVLFVPRRRGFAFILGAWYTMPGTDVGYAAIRPGTSAL
eukprot:3755883-Rhodomonas_salina.5